MNESTVKPPRPRPPSGPFWLKPEDEAAPKALAIAPAAPELPQLPISPYQQLAEMVVATCNSPHTRRVYAARLTEFFRLGHPLTRDGVLAWILHKRTHEMAKAPTIATCLAAVKRLAEEAEIRGLLNPLEARNIAKIKGMRDKGTRSGNWLTLAGAQQLMALPDRTKLTGKRDASIIALLLGCGLRREEAARMTWQHYQERDGRMCLVDIHGKGNRIRTVPIPDWAKSDLNVWMAEMSTRGMAGRTDLILHRMSKLKRFGTRGNPTVSRLPLTSFGVWHVMRLYATKLNIPKLTPHDLRRTLARLMRKSGCAWEQIQFTLGHANMVTTQQYVGGVELDEGRAGVDMVDWGR